ncbi:cation transporter [Roseiconus nitratireducens]|uniref:Cation transporter n=2 Tax=Roseiconus nitratireducens TaxID=2605748 RepID=A0A5M6D371_9BACT|nr:cation transporter [Roseiconus nitratireducens]
MAESHHDHPHDHTHDHAHDSGGHVHGLTRGGELAGVSDSRLLWAVALNQLLTVGQVIAGIFSGSVALLSDAAHNFNDANALLIAYIARRISRRDANQRYTFGYRRAELIGATINLTSLGLIGMFLIYEGIRHFIEPQEIVGWLMASAAGLALIIDVGTAVLLWSMSQGSINVRAAFVHNLVDALGSLAVLLGAAAVIWWDWTWIDPLLTLIIAGYVLWQVATMLPQAARILMEGAPHDFDFDAMVSAVQAVPAVEGAHHFHLWELDEQRTALEAHVVIAKSNARDLEAIKQTLKELLQHEFGIEHSTLEFEFSDHDCPDNHDCY